MKTKIKRHYRSVLSVVLAVCMLVSCMTVGLIATDAAKVTNSDTAIGAKADSEDDALGAKDDNEAVGYNSNATGYLQSSSGTPITDVAGTGAATGTITFTVSSYQGSFLRFYIKADNGDQFGIDNSSTTNNYLSNGTNNWNLAKGNYVAYYKVGANAETVTFTYESLDGSPKISVSETTGSGGGGSGSTTTDTVNQTSGTTMFIAAFTDSGDTYYTNKSLDLYLGEQHNSYTSASGGSTVAMTSANYGGVHYYKPTNKGNTTQDIGFQLCTTGWNNCWNNGIVAGFNEGDQYVAYRTSSSSGSPTVAEFDSLELVNIEYPNLIASGSTASIKIKADGGFPKFYYDVLKNNSDQKKYKLTVTNNSGTKIVDAQTFKYHADSGEYSFNWTPSSTADNQLTFALSDDDGIDTVTYTKTFTVGYGVTISAGAGGSVSPSGTKAIGSTAVSITATPNTGYAFSNWTTTGGASVASSTSASTTVTASAEGTVKANFTKNSYTLSKGTETNGTFTLTPAPGSVAYNTAVTVAPSPNENYVVSNVTYTSGSKTETVSKTNGKYVFNMPAGDTTVNVTFALKGYEVVSEGHYSSSQYTMKELTNGMFITTTKVPSTHWFKIVNTATNQISKGSNASGEQNLSKDTLYDVTSWEAKPVSWVANGSFDNNSGADAYVVYDPANDQVYLTTESDGMFSTYYVYLKNGTVRWDSENKRWATDTTAYFGTTTLESDSTVTTTTIPQKSGGGDNYDSKVKLVTLTAAQVRNGVNLHIKTTVNSSKQSAWYVTGFDVNGGLTQGIISQEFDDNGVALETGSYVDNPQAGTKIAGHYNDFTLKINGEDLPEKNIEVTPIYFPLATSSDDFVRFYAYDFTDDVKDIWGGSLAVYPYIQGGWEPYGRYPGQLMVFEGGSYYSDIPATDSNNVPMDGLTMNNYIFDTVHYDLFYGSNQDQQHYQTYDYNEFKIINDIIQKSNSDEDIIFSFKYKDSKSLDESNLGRSTYYKDSVSESLSGYDYTYDYRNGYFNLDPDDPQYQFENLTDFYGNRVDIFDQLVDVDGNETKEAYNPILIISNGYDYSAIGKYATAWALYVPKDASGNDAFTGPVDHYELFEVYGGQGMNTHQSESYLINPKFALSIRCKYGDTAHLTEYQEAFKKENPGKTVPTHIRDCEYIPVKISYEYEGYSGKSNLNLEGETQNGNVSNRSDGRWYYSSSDMLLNSHTIIEVADSINGTFTRDYYQNGIDYTSDSGYDPSYNTGLGTGVKAYFTNDNKVEYGTGTYYQNVDGNTRAYAISDGKSMHNYKLKAEEDPDGNYTFVGWYRLTDTGSGIGYTIASKELEFETQAKTNDVFVARFIKIPSGNLQITHNLDASSNGNADCYTKVEVLDSSDTVIDSTSFPKTTNSIKVLSNYIKCNSDNKLRITIETAPDDYGVLSGFNENISGNLQELTQANVGASIPDATVTTNISTKTATITFDIKKLFTTTDPATAQQNIKSIPLYSIVNEYTYKIDYTYPSRLYGNQIYTAEGKLLASEYLNSTYRDPSTDRLTGAFVSLKQVYEDNFMKNMTWNYNSITTDKTEYQYTAAITATQPETAPTKNLQFNFPYEYQSTTIGGKTIYTAKEACPTYYDNSQQDPSPIAVPYMEGYYGEVKEGNETKYYFTQAPASVKVGSTIYPFQYWSLKVGGSEVARCYSRNFNFAMFNNYTVTPIFSNTGSGAIGSDTAATITFLEYSRNQWNYDQKGTRSTSKTAMDTVYADFDLSFTNKGELIDARSATEVGVIIENLGKLTEDGSGGYVTDMATYSDRTQYKNDLKTFINAGGTDAAKTTYLAATGNTSQNVTKRAINKSILTNKNRTEYYLGINASENGEDTNNRTSLYRIYSYIKNGSTVTLSDPVYINIYAEASK